jgi:hypothetical protein
VSSGPAPLSPFVRGTTDQRVYFLQGGLRRLIPDTATLTFMAGGQGVRTLSDADLNAINLGNPLPSRANGKLMAPRPLPHQLSRPVFLMSQGLRRGSPDFPTSSLLFESGLVQDVDAADLNVIPEGPRLPTRQHGTTYRGTGGVFAFLIQDGRKCPVPNATTLRDAGQDPTALLPITASDLAFIPDGDPLASTSRFLNPPAAAVPLVLFPVRLETRFQGSELWVRVFPDDVHVNSFERDLTADESKARAAFVAEAQGGGPAAKTAFAALAQQYGPERAAWIASAKAQPGNKPGQWAHTPFTDVLPERWIVIGFLGNAPGQVLAVGNPIADSLAVGPAPDGPGPATDEGMQWLVDFNRAISVGMAMRIPLMGAQTRGFNRLVVLGLKSDLSPADSVNRLSALLEAHHYTDGLELLRHGAPTNNTEDVKSALATSDPNFSQLFALEQGPPLSPKRPTADGDRLARALGIGPSLLAHVRGADGNQEEQARSINAVLWPATWGYYLDQIVTGAVPAPESILPAARSHFVEHVRARGHFPILRIGRQPYGLLPVLWSAQWAPLEGRPIDATLHNLLNRLRPTWEASVANVPVVSGTADPEAALVSILGMSPSSGSYVTRSLIGPEYNLTFWKFVRQDIGQAWWATLSERSLASTGDLASTLMNTRLANATFVTDHRRLTDDLVAPAPLDSIRPPTYIAPMSTMGWQALRDLTLPAPPVPLLMLLLRHAALRQYVDTAADMLTKAGAAQPVERLEPELVGLSAAPARPTPWDLLQRTLPGQGPVGTFLDGARHNSAVPEFVDFWTSFNNLGTYSAEALDFAAREVLDLAAYRLDAWVTSMAHFRLDEIRRAAPSGGIVLGGYGWAENVHPQPSLAASAGFIHAPSLAHATTAAVLRSGYLSHQNATTSPFEIDLSSDRVRLGLHLLDGIRTGQPLGALLGYRLERTMHDGGLEPFIDNLRALSRIEGSDVPEDVIDGLALLRKVHDDARVLSSPGLPSDAPTHDKLVTAVKRLDDALDAVADLTLSESVHQLLRGNTIRAGATLDAIARGDAPPPELDVVKTPRTGTALTHRLFAIAVGERAPGWATTARAKAEPRLNSWAASLLGAPTRVHARARFLDASKASFGTVEFGLDKLALAPLDFLALPDTSGPVGELADRLRRAASALRPASVPASATVDLVQDRDPAWGPDVISVLEFLGLVQAVSRVAGGARALEPRDLVAPGDTAGTINTTELQQRADAAELQIRAVRTSLQGTGLETALLNAAELGASGAVPALDRALWRAQADAAGLELAGRIAKLERLATGFVRSSATSDGLRDHDLARLKAVFGDQFLVLPTLAPALTATWPQIWGNSAALQAGDALAAQRWFSRASRVRPGAARLDTALLYAESLAGHSILHLDIAQLPFAAGDRWLALELAGAAPSSRLSMAAFSPTAFTAGANVAGLMIDDWVEVLPSAQQTTGISFHCDDPTSRAPQAILLGVHPDAFPEWTFEAVEGTILEALDLAKLRAVDPDALGSLGHYLPALFFAYNTGGSRDAVATDFNLSVLTSQIRDT